MNLLSKAGAICALLVASMPLAGNAQYQHTVDPFLSNFGNAKRWEIGGGTSMPAGSFTGVVHVMGQNGAYKGDTTATRDLSGTGISGCVGLTLPFKATGHISCWAATLHLMGSMYTWGDLNQTVGLDGSYSPKTPTLSASTMQISLPIGIDYKIGNDAILTKRLPFGASVGAGLMPLFTMTTLPDISAFKAQYGCGVNPYAKLDLSIFAGICWKLRIMYNVGQVNLLDVNSQLGSYNDGPFKISSSSALSFSLIFMPFSGGWKEFAWYNTYDTYNTHDRLN